MLDRLLVPASEIGSLEEWRSLHLQTIAGIERPIERAIAAAARMDRLGYAFASGYQAALSALYPGLTGSCALAATEEGGAHPRAINSSLRDGKVSGKKVWCTLSPVASEVLVVARTGEDESARPILKVARVRLDRAGVRIEPMPDAPFVPEIPHATVVFDAAAVEEIFPGDGYSDYLKPFRTIEDIHVLAAALAHLSARGLREKWDLEVVEDLLGSLSSVIGLSVLPVGSPVTHLALAGAWRAASALFSRLDPLIAARGGDQAARWARDRPLFSVAQRARDARRAAARERLGI